MGEAKVRDPRWYGPAREQADLTPQPRLDLRVRRRGRVDPRRQTQARDERMSRVERTQPWTASEGSLVDRWAAPVGRSACAAQGVLHPRLVLGL
jgi:hypothetical protein